MRELGLCAHVAAMMVAFAALPGAGLLLRVLTRQMDGPEIQRAAKALAPVFRFGSAVVAFGILAGFALAADYGFWRPWLLATYVLVVIVAVNGAVIEGGWARRLATASPEAIPAIRAEPLARAATWAGLVLWALLLWLMVAKPDG